MDAMSSYLWISRAFSWSIEVVLSLALLVVTLWIVRRHHRGAAKLMLIAAVIEILLATVGQAAALWATTHAARAGANTILIVQSAQYALYSALHAGAFVILLVGIVRLARAAP
jgi:hypothetical protein